MHTVRARASHEQDTTTEERRKRWRGRSKRARLVHSVGKSSQENYLAERNTWVNGRQAQGKGPWLHTIDDPNARLTELLELMMSRCFVRTNQHSSVRGYLAAIKFSQDIRRLGATLVALHDSRSGKGDRQGARYVSKEKTS